MGDSGCAYLELGISDKSPPTPDPHASRAADRRLKKTALPSLAAFRHTERSKMMFF